MNYMDLRRQWLDHNELGTSKDEGRGGGDGVFYRNNVLYTNNHPNQRFIWGRKGKAVVLHWHPTYAGGFKLKVDDAKVNGKTIRFDNASIYVPDIGVFSRHHDDQMTDDELHSRMKYILLMEARSFTAENVEKMTGKFLDTERYHSHGNNKITIGERFERDLTEHYQRWNFYSDMFDLGWDELPSIYMDQLRDTVKRKVDKYNDPKAVAQRERTIARKKAKEALGVG